jgi:hypothetical protein
MLKTNKEGKRKLVLDKQTVRELTAEELAEAAGGTGWSCATVIISLASMIYTYTR